MECVSDRDEYATRMERRRESLDFIVFASETLRFHVVQSEQLVNALRDGDEGRGARFASSPATGRPARLGRAEQRPHAISIVRLQTVPFTGVVKGCFELGRTG